MGDDRLVEILRLVVLFFRFGTMFEPMARHATPKFLPVLQRLIVQTLLAIQPECFSAGEGIFIPHAGTMQSLTAPSTPSVTNLTYINNETAAVPSSAPYQITVAQGRCRCQMGGVSYNNDTAGKNSALLNVGTLTPGLAEYTIGTGGVLTFSSADAGRSVIYSYYYNDISGATTHTYQVAQIDTFGGESLASSVITTATSNAALSTTNRNRVSWPSLNATGYALYRDGKLIAKVDELPKWRPRWMYRLGDIVVPPNGNGHQYIVVQEGYSGDSAPSFSTSAGATVQETPDGGDTADGVLGVVWQEYGTPTVTFDDVNQNGSNFALAFGGQSSYEPNISNTPPVSALADAFVTEVQSVIGNTLVLQTTPITSASNILVAHDDTAAFQSLINQLGINSLTRSVTMHVPDGVCRISSPISVPSGAPATLSMFGEAAQGGLLTNQIYGSQNWQEYGAHTSPGGGSVLQAITAMSAMLDFSQVTTSFSGAPHISNITFLGYGVGQQTGFQGQSINSQGGPVLSYAAFDQDNFYNLYQGFDSILQFSTFTKPIFVGNKYGLVAPASVTGESQFNQINIDAPQTANNSVAMVLRGGGS